MGKPIPGPWAGNRSGPPARRRVGVILACPAGTRIIPVWPKLKRPTEYMD